MNQDLAIINAATRARVEWLLQRLCVDPASWNHGGFVLENNYADTRDSIYDAQTLFAVYLYPDFPEFYHQPEMLAVLRRVAEFMGRRQMPDGSVGLGPAGIGSGNEVGFTLPGVCSTYARLAASDAPGKEELLAVLRAYVLRGVECMHAQWPHTSNHRWTAYAGPLAYAQSLFPDPRNLRLIDDLLSDGIDIDLQGLYYEERSPNYDDVANWGLLYLVDRYGRKDYFDLVRRNLDFTLAMRQPCGEAETLFSNRQDRGQTGRPSGSWYPFKRLAAELGRGDFAQMADDLLQVIATHPEHRGPLIPYRYLLDNPRLADEAVVRTPPAETFDLRCTGAPIRRWRDGQRAVTLVADRGEHYWDAVYGNWGAVTRSDAFLDFHVGAAVIDAVKIRWGSGAGGFRPEAIEDLPDGTLRLFYRDPGTDHIPHYRPEGKRQPRRVFVDQWAEVLLTRTARGVRLAVKIDGWHGAPVNLQLLLRETCELVEAGKPALPLTMGGRTFSRGKDFQLLGPDGSCLLIEGLPDSQHEIVLGEPYAITGAAEKRCHRLVSGLLTPAAFTLTMEQD